MDYSEIYQKMCNCLEIQDLVEEMDLDEHSFWLIRTKDKYCEHCRMYGEDTYCAGCGKKLTIRINGYIDKSKNNYHESIFLPRQDQIQEMLGTNNKEPFCDWLSKLEKFTHIAQPWDIPIKDGLKTIGWFETWEQLWLAFYMHENHKKTWNGKKWIKK